MSATCPKCNRPIPPDAPGGVCPHCVLENVLFDRSPQASTLSPEAERDLVFSLFAVQLGAVTPTIFIQVGMEWIGDPNIGLADRLCQAAKIPQEKIDLIWSLADAAIRHHRGDVKQTLGDLQAQQMVSDLFDIAADASLTGHRTQLGLPLAVDSDISDPGAMREAPGRYSRKSEYSRGGMGRILLVHDQYLTRDVALKELLPSRLTTRDPSSGKDTPLKHTAMLIARFLREAKVTGQLEHPNIVPVYELGQKDDGNFFYTMKLIRGESMAALLAKTKTLDERLKYLPNFIDLCQALAYAHSRRVIHRDIKPSNVMIGPFGETVVIDWGLVKVLGQEDPLAEEMAAAVESLHDQTSIDDADTRPGARMGTPAYMSPEQARGEIPLLDARSDVFNLGAMLYELLTGSTPFGNLAPGAIMYRMGHEAVPPAESINPDVPPELAAICAKALAFEMDKRYADAGDLVTDLERFVTGALVSAYSYSAGDMVRRYYQRHKAAVRVAAAAAVLLVGFATYAYVRIYNERDAAVTARNEAQDLAYINGIRLAERDIDNREFDQAAALLDQLPESRRNWEWNHLRLRAEPSLHVFDGYNNAAWSGDGSRMVLAGVNLPVLYVDTETYATVREIETDLTRPNTVAHSPTAEMAACAGVDGLVRIFELSGVSPVIELQGHRSSVQFAVFSPNGQLLATHCSGADRRVLLWNLADGSIATAIEREGASAYANGFDRSGRYLTGQFVAAAGTDTAVGTPHVWAWDVNLETIALNTPGVAIVVDSVGSHAYVAHGPNIEVWPLEGGTSPVNLWNFGDTDISCLAVSPAGNVLAASDITGHSRLWDIQSGSVFLDIPGSEPLRSLMFSPDGTLLLTTLAHAPTAHVWEITTGGIVNRLVGHQKSLPLLSAAFSPDGSRVLTTGFDQQTRVWPAMGDRASRLLYAAGGTGRSLSIDTSGLYATVVSVGGRAVTIRTNDGAAESAVQSGGTRSTGHGFISSDGRYVAGLADPVTPVVVERSPGATASLMREHSGPITVLAGMPDGTTAVSAEWGGSVLHWEIATGVVRGRIDLDGHRPSALAVGEDGGAYIGSAEGNVFVWRTQSGEQPATLGSTGEGISALLRLRDGGIVAGTHAGRIYYWSSATDTDPQIWPTSSGALDCIAQSPSGVRLLTASALGASSIRSWPAFKQLTDFPANGPHSDIAGLAVAGDSGDVITLGESTGEVRRWFGRGNPPVAQSATSSQLEPLPLRTFTTDEAVTWLAARVGSGIDLSTRVHETHILQWFGLQVGDRVTAVGNSAVSDGTAFAAALTDSLANSPQIMPTLTVESSGTRWRVTWDIVPKREIRETVSVSLPDVQRALARHAAKLLRIEGDSYPVCAEYYSQLGIDVRADGWPMGMPIAWDDESDAQLLRMLRLWPGDRLVEWGGLPITNKQDFLNANAALNEIEEAPPQSIVAVVDRGLFQRVYVSYAAES